MAEPNNIGEMFVRLSGDVSGLRRSMGEAQSNVDRAVKGMTSSLAKLGIALSAGAFFNSLIRNSIAAQDAMAQLEARVRSTGGAAGRSVGQLDALSQALARKTTFDDEAVKSAEALLLTFKKVRGDEFDRATAAALDLATAMGSDVNSAALQLGKALEDPIRGLAALRRSGVSFTQGQQDVIKAMVQANNVAGAQNLILAELESQFGGAAAAARDTLGGALKALANAWGDTLEVSRSSSSGIIGAINGISDVLPKVRDRIDEFFGGVQLLGVDAAVALGKVEVGLIRIGRLNPAFLFTDADNKALDSALAQLRNLQTAADEVRKSIVGGDGVAPAFRTLTQNFEEAAASAEQLDTKVKGLRAGLGGLGSAGDIMDAGGGRTDTSGAKAAADDFLKQAAVAFGSVARDTSRFQVAQGVSPGGPRSGFAGPEIVGSQSASKLDQLLAPLSEAFAELKAVLSPMAITGEFLNGVFAAMRPVLEALMVPIRDIGFLLGSVLAPVLKLLQPVLDGVAKAFAFVIQGIGEFIKGLGKAINFLLPGNPANGLVRFGESMVDMAKQTRAAISAGTDLTKKLDQVTASASNLPPIFDLIARRRQAGSDFSPVGRLAVSRAGLTVNVNNPAAGVNPKEIIRQVTQGITELSRRGGVSGIDLALQGAE